MPWLILAAMGAGAYLYGLSMHATLLCLISKQYRYWRCSAGCKMLHPALIGAGSALA